MTCALVTSVLHLGVTRWLRCTLPADHDGDCRFVLAATGYPMGGDPT